MNRFSPFGLKAGRRVAMGTDRILGGNTTYRSGDRRAEEGDIHPATSHRQLRFIVIHQMVTMGPLALILVWYGYGFGLILWCLTYAVIRYSNPARR